MSRICEEVQSMVATAPHSLAATTDSTPIYIDGSGFPTLDFVIAHAALVAGKSLTVKVMCSANANGADADEIGSYVKTYDAAVTNGAVTVSVDVQGNRDRYYAVVFQHDNTSAVQCCAVALGKPIYRPPDRVGVILW